MKKLKEWLFKATDSIETKAQLVMAAFLINVAWLTCLVPVLRYINVEAPNWVEMFFYSCIMAPLWEEVVFRVVPIQIARAANEKLIIPVVLLSSIIFGLVHGGGTDSILIQGVGGLIASIVYIKTNYSYWSAVALHSLWNTFILFAQPKF